MFRNTENLPVFFLKNPTDLPDDPPTCCLVVSDPEADAVAVVNTALRHIGKSGDIVKVFRTSISPVPTMYRVAIRPDGSRSTGFFDLVPA
jgi:hypothetical protein